MDDAAPVKLAALVTDYRPGTHADVLLSKFIHGFACDEPAVHPPRTVIASLFIDQFSPGEIGRAVAKQHGIPLYNSIQGALTLGDDRYYEDHSDGQHGTGSAEGAPFAFKEPSGGAAARGALHLAPQLAVDGVLIIAEHGDWPWNEQEARIHPRKSWLEQVCAVFAQSGGRVCPVFNGAYTLYSLSALHQSIVVCPSQPLPKSCLSQTNTSHHRGQSLSGWSSAARSSAHRSWEGAPSQARGAAPSSSTLRCVSMHAIFCPKRGDHV
jgi:hypothetical protein|eukprot:COSAG06_NODE_3185_length_5718_cov_5.232960_8_plen_267_part_00